MVPIRLGLLLIYFKLRGGGDNWRENGALSNPSLIINIILNSFIKDAKETFFPSIIESRNDEQRTLFKSIDCMSNRKPETRYPTCASDHHLAENFINLFTEKIDTIRATVIADTLSTSFT